MRVLHTADWHIGKTLYGKKRYEEFEAFLNWLAETILNEKVEVLLVAGDVFDTGAPSNRAQELYYRFLCRIAASPCRHAIVIAGNHDSPSFLNAPRDLLKAINIHVVGAGLNDPENEVITLMDLKGKAELIVCAVPYLRDRDIRNSEAGESLEDKDRKLVEGIRNHYATVAAIAEKRQKDTGQNTPIIGMGHLFTAGGETIDGDGVRELYIGTLAHVSGNLFPKSFNYLALGHLHVPQKVNGSEFMRYSGSPLPMGFGEANHQKSLCLVDFDHAVPRVKLLDVPTFQKLERIKGNLEEIVEKIGELKSKGSKAWLEIVHENRDAICRLRERLEEAVSDSEMEILRIKNHRLTAPTISAIQESETLDDLEVDDVFVRCLSHHEVPVDQHVELIRSYQEILKSIYEDDNQAE